MVKEKNSCCNQSSSEWEIRYFLKNSKVIYFSTRKIYIDSINSFLSIRESHKFTNQTIITVKKRLSRSGHAYSAIHHQKGKPTPVDVKIL